MACKTVANMIKGKQPEEIRKTFNIKNDFTPQEEEQVCLTYLALLFLLTSCYPSERFFCLLSSVDPQGERVVRGEMIILYDLSAFNNPSASSRHESTVCYVR